MQNKIAYVVFV